MLNHYYALLLFIAFLFALLYNRNIYYLKDEVLSSMRTILAFIFVFLFLIVSLPLLGIEWIVSKFNKRAADISMLRYVQWGFKMVMFFSGTKLTVIGEENVPKDEPILYIGNHRGIFDAVVTYARCPGLTGYISKNSVAKVPILNLVMKRIYCLFIDREDIKQSMKVILSAIDYVKQGVSICIFPEGTRNKDKSNSASVLTFKEGSFKIAQKTGCKIVPMAITGTAEIFEDHLPWIHSRHVILQYGKPVDISALPKEEQKKVGAYCQAKVVEMLETHKALM